MLLRKYDTSLILSLEWQEGKELIQKAYEVESDGRIWQKWLVDYRLMTEDNFIDFETYKAMSTGKVDRTKPAEEIIKESEEILKRIKNSQKGR